jgi:hypothetical protein
MEMHFLSLFGKNKGDTMKYITALLLCAILVGAWGRIAVSIYNDRTEYGKYISAGDSYVSEEIYIKAINSYRSALKYNTNNIELEKKIIQTYYDMGDYESYCNYNLQMVEKYPGDTYFYLNLLEYYKENNDRKFIQFIYTIPEDVQADEDVWSYVQYAKSLYDMQYLGIDEMTDFLFGYSRVTKKTIQDDGNTIETQYLFGTDGTQLFDEQSYLSVSPIGNASQYLVQEEDKTWKIINGEGYVLAQRKNTEFGMISPFTYNYTSAVVDGKPCYITTEFKIADMSKNTSISNFSNGYAAVEKDGKYALMDSDLSLISEYQYDDVKQDSFGRTYMNNCFFVKENGTYFLVNNKNERISDLEFDDVKVFADSQPTAVKQGDLWGFVNSSGEMYIECQYEDAKPYSNGYAAVKQNGLWGYIDAKGKFVMEPEFTEAGNMTKEGVCLVKKEEEDEDGANKYYLLTYYYLSLQS